MISDFSACVRKLLLSVCLCVLPSLSIALCEELSRVGLGDDGTFFVSCKNTFAKPQYLITEYYSGGERNSFVSFRDGRHGFMCSAKDKAPDCMSMPRGALDFKTFEVKEGLEGVIEDINAARKRYQGIPADYSYPRSASGAKTQGCYLRVYGEERVVFGFDQKRLYSASLCLVAFERYLAGNKSLLLK